MKKVLMIVGGIFVGFVVLFFVIFMLTSLNSEKLVCKSKEGNITIMYDEETIKGYAASGINYDLDGQKAVAEQIGIEEYLEQFSNWFATNTSGTCSR